MYGTKEAVGNDKMALQPFKGSHSVALVIKGKWVKWKWHLWSSMKENRT